MPDRMIVAVAGASGRLGHLIVRALLARGADVRALVRPGTAPEKLAGLEGAAILPVSLDDAAALTSALAGVDVVVSALNGLREVIVDAQTALLNAAVAAGVERFIPSDYAADLTRLAPGENRNFDLRREFRTRLLAAPIRSTSVLNGGFMELLQHGRMIDAKARSVSHFGSPDQPLDYTTMPDVAAFTAAAALDRDAPEILRVVGDAVSARDVAGIAGDITGTPFVLVSLGSIDELAAMIAAERKAHPEAENEVFPRFQQLQYTHNMQSGRGRLTPLDNERYGIKTTRVRDLLSTSLPPKLKEPAMSRIVVIGGHGRTGILVVGQLVAAGHQVVATIRNAHHLPALVKLGAETVVLDLEKSTGPDFQRAFRAADAVVFAAGSAEGEGSAIDRIGTVKTVRAAETAGVPRYISISALGDSTRLKGVKLSAEMQDYYKQKRAGSKRIRASSLEWTILEPGGLTDDKGTGRITLGETGLDSGEIARADVAATVVAVIGLPATAGRTFQLVAGNTPIDKALRAALASPPPGRG